MFCWHLNNRSLRFSEQRVTALVVGILSGLSVFMTKILKVIFLFTLVINTNVHIVIMYFTSKE